MNFFEKSTGVKPSVISRKRFNINSLDQRFQSGLSITLKGEEFPIEQKNSFDFHSIVIGSTIIHAHKALNK